MPQFFDYIPSMSAQKPVILCILDGWGYRETVTDNAVALAATPNWDKILKNCPQTLLKTCGLDVGLPTGQMGNSEVGHMNLGAGRVVMQDLPRIDQAIESGTLWKNPELLLLIQKLRQTGGACHLFGLFSPGGVHAHQDHILALCRIMNAEKIPTLLHLCTDGRDTPPKSAETYIQSLLRELPNLEFVKLGTLTGRYYAMDRDKRWERVELAYRAITDGAGTRGNDVLAALHKAYESGETDEFLKPIIFPDFREMRDGDALLCANFRSDRMRQILAPLLDESFKDFTTRKISFCAAVAMTEYSEDLKKRMRVLFPAQNLSELMGDVVAKNGLKQLRLAETEKYPHVTFFFNGGEEKELPGEDRILVPSPKVATYDLKPEMSAIEVTDKLVAAIESKKYDFILVNYANPDMVGHTGILEAAIKAVETVDQCLGRVIAALEKAGGVMFVTADHGNAETMRDPDTGVPHTAHTLNPVKAVLVNDKGGNALTDGGRLADVAPTLLQLLNVPQPAAMTGHSLLDKRKSDRAA